MPGSINVMSAFTRSASPTTEAGDTSSRQSSAISDQTSTKTATGTSRSRRMRRRRERGMGMGGSWTGFMPRFRPPP